MPVEFLSDDDAASYGRFTRVPDQKELERAFFLDDVDKELIAKRRGDHNRLGFALQLTTVRWLGTFLPDPLDVPEEVVAYLAEQVGVADTSCASRYPWAAPGTPSPGGLRHRRGTGARVVETPRLRAPA